MLKDDSRLTVPGSNLLVVESEPASYLSSCLSILSPNSAREVPGNRVDLRNYALER